MSLVLFALKGGLFEIIATLLALDAERGVDALERLPLSTCLLPPTFGLYTCVAACDKKSHTNSRLNTSRRFKEASNKVVAMIFPRYYCIIEACGLRLFDGCVSHNCRSAPPVPRKQQEAAAPISRVSHPVDGLVGVLFSTVRRAYGPVSLPGDVTIDGASAFDAYSSAFVVRGPGCTERESVSFDSVPEQGRSGDEGLLTPGCGKGFGAGVLDLCLADQSSSLLRELYKVGFPSCLVVTTVDAVLQSAARCSVLYDARGAVMFTGR